MPSTSHFYIHREYTLWSAALPNDWTSGTAILSTGTEDNEVMDAKDCNYLVLHIYFALASLSSVDLRINFGRSVVTTVYQETNSTYAAGVQTESALIHRYSATGTYRLMVPIMDRYIRIQVIGNGDPTNSDAVIKGFVGTA